MNDGTGGRRPRRIRSPRTGLLAIVAGVALLTAACSGGSSSSADPGTSPASMASSSSGGSGGSIAGKPSAYQKALAFAQCMRTHGVPAWPDPVGNGGFITTNVPGIGHHGQPDSPQIQAAEKACESLDPAESLSPQQQQQALNNLLKYSACMRSHGIPDFPDPVVGSDGSITLSIKGSALSTLRSPLGQAAQRACKSLLPAGAPS